MTRGIDRRHFLKQGVMTAAALSVSPRIVRGVNQGAGRAAQTTAATVDAGRIRELASQRQGQVLLPGDRDYLSACRNWTGQIPVRPALLVRCASTEDVVASVNFARENETTGSINGVRPGELT